MRSRTLKRIPSAEDAHDEPATRSDCATSSGSSSGTNRKFVRRGQRLEAEGAASALASPLALLDLSAHVGRIGEAASASAADSESRRPAAPGGAFSSAAVSASASA